MTTLLSTGPQRSREFVPLDQLHLENLHATLLEFGLDAAGFDDELADLDATWQRVEPWEDSVAGVAELGKQVIVGQLSNANLALLLRMALRTNCRGSWLSVLTAARGRLTILKSSAQVALSLV
jgi:hypothetical protein